MVQTIKAGYKQTEVGVIPEDWQLECIGDIFTFYPTSNYSKAEMRLDGEVGCIHYGLIHAIDNTSYSLSKGLKYYVMKEQAKYEKIQDGDVIMVDASEDLIGLNKSVEVFDVNNKEYIAGLHTFHLRDKNSFCTNNFRGLILNSNAVKTQMLRLVVGMKVFGVSKPQLQKILIPLPTKAEQTAIATALSDMDDLINSLSALIEKKKAIKQGAMQELLKPKEGWVVKKLGEVAEFYKGKGLPKSELDENGPCKCIHYGELFTKYNEKIEQIFSYTNQNKYCFLSKSNDVLMPTSDVTPNGLAKASCIKEDNVILGGDVLIIRVPETVVNGVFLSYSITNDKTQVLGLVSGSTVYHLYGSDMARFEINLPLNIDEQNEIANILTEMTGEISYLKKNLSKYQLLKQGMMQELLTGKIRLI